MGSETIIEMNTWITEVQVGDMMIMGDGIPVVAVPCTTGARR